MEKLTHEEACRLVEQELERAVKTLAYIRMKLGKDPKSVTSLQIETAMQKSNLLRNVNNYGAYIQGALTMYRRLEEEGLLETVHPKNFGKVTTERRMMNGSIMKLITRSSRNLDWFLHGMPGGVEIMTRFERDAKGRVKGAESVYYKKETTVRVLEDGDEGEE